MREKAKMDLVIPFRPGPKNSVELRYTLRSAEQFFELLGEGDCFLLGKEHPDWYRGCFVNIDQPANYSQISGVISKLHEFVEHYGSSEFCYLNDDTMLLRKWDGTRFYNKRATSGSGYHAVTVERAKFLLGQRGIPFAHDFELHAPVMLRTAYVRQLLDSIDYCAPIAFRTLYCNAYPEDSVGIPDCKVMNFMKPDMKWRFLSSDDSFVPRHDFLAWLQERFPHRSRWEK